MNRFPLFMLLLAGVGQAWAQSVPAQADVILRTDGTEVPGRVLTITPRDLSYLPPTGADTLRLAVADVFLVRYANGTRELLHPASAADMAETSGNPLRPPDGAGRTARGQADAHRRYRGREAFSGALGSAFVLGPFVGVLSTLAIANAPVSERNWRAPAPGLLADYEYTNGYRQQANATKRRRTWAGYAVGAGLQVLVLGVMLGGVKL